MNKGPLRLVAHRGPASPDVAYWIETLMCGHKVVFDGNHAVKWRRCPICPLGWDGVTPPLPFDD